jgi:hypothetical protein
MNILTCYKKGTGEATARPKIVLLLWAANAVFAVLAYMLFSSVFASALGRSGAAAGLMKAPDMNVLFEALMGSGRPLGVLQAAIFTLILFYFFVSIFLQGGVLAGLVDGSLDDRSGRVFFSGGAQYYGKFLRLAVYSLVLWAPAAIFFGLVSALMKALTGGSTHEQFTFCLTLVRVALAVFLLFLIKMIMDYARIRIVTGKTNKIFRSLLDSIRFVCGRPGLTLGLYYLLGLTGLVLFAAWRLVIHAVPVTTTAAVWGVFLLTQVYIFSRAWLHLAYQSAQLVNYRTHTAPQA